MSAKNLAHNITGASGFQLFIAHLGVILTVTAWGTSFISTKVLMSGDEGFTPVQMFTYRFAFAYLLLLILTIRKLKSDSWRDELTFLVCGICSGSLYFITENYALQHTATANVSLLASISPIFTTVLVAAVYKMKIQPGVIIGSVIAFAGVGCIIFSNGDGFEIHPFGDLLALSAAFSWGIYTVLVRRVIPHYNSLFITRKLFFYGVLTSLPLLLMNGAPYHLEKLFMLDHPQYWGNFLFLSCVCSMGAYLVWNESMKKLGSVMANNYLYGQPLVTMIAAYFILNEEVRLLGYIGCALIIGGLILSDKLKIGKH